MSTESIGAASFVTIIQLRILWGSLFLIVGCRAPMDEEAPAPVHERSQEEGEVIPDFADAPSITVEWILEDPDAIAQLALLAPLVHARIASTSQEPTLVSGVWTVEYAGSASRVALQPFSLEAGATRDVALDLAAHC